KERGFTKGSLRAGGTHPATDRAGRRDQGVGLMMLAAYAGEKTKNFWLLLYWPRASYRKKAFVPANRPRLSRICTRNQPSFPVRGKLASVTVSPGLTTAL